MSRFKTKLLKKTADENEGEFEVALTAKAEARGSVKVMAKNAKEAQDLAMDMLGEVMWEYGDIEDGSVKTEVPGTEVEDGMEEMPEMPEMEEGMPEPDAAPAPEAGPEMPAPEMPAPGPDMAMDSRFARKLKERS
jgi:hypothetical protein